ncbi:4Fe-4S dicluster domain-containing protein [Ferrimonas lipolytica]|uniref:4Fe-4S dicluster domain-containing protein n=2 Tax=Ferrimonas lipolytica TaxID=2724191 RepID=A0A6H1UIA0_9GAMM|nr:4Fe-4S dicluster domain-containing protein [Ferrimonas lipolytica]
MFELFKTIANAGKSTSKYPFAPYEVAPDFRGKPEYTPEQCIACAACTKACPANALVMTTDAESGARQWQLSLARCIYCGRCEEVCPTKAITLSKEFELAVGQKKDLYQRAVFTLQQCNQCGTPYAPTKAVQYAYDLLLAAGEDKTELERTRSVIEMCPECRRKRNMLGSSNVLIGSLAKERNA